MFSRLTRHLTYANVVATIALLFALTTGGAVAASTLKKNSVTSQAIKKNAVTSAKIKGNAVTSSKVKDRSLLAKDFKTGELPAGPTGPAGSAKAFAFVNEDGSLNSARSSANISSRRYDAGRYCLTVTGVPVKTAIVSLVAGTSHHSTGDNEWGLIDWLYPGGSSNPCESGELVVRTFYAVTPGPDVTYDDAEFSIIVE